MSFIAFRALLDNYETETGQAEEVTEEEFKENVNFINLIMETGIMKEVHSYLVEKEKAPAEVDDFKRLLYKIWFKLYRRSREDR
jgi:poly(U)-specific endoribonuclease